MIPIIVVSFFLVDTSTNGFRKYIYHIMYLKINGIFMFDNVRYYNNQTDGKFTPTYNM